MAGPGHVKETSLGPAFLVSPTSFFQTNVAAAATLVRLVIEALPGERGLRVLDLYSGSGLFALPVALRGHRVTAVEESRKSVKDAELNRRLNGLTEERLKLVCSAVEQALPHYKPGAFDAVILDPPREGCPPEVVRAVFGRLQPARGILVSCNPEALARELPLAVAAGYRVLRVQPVDMFPHTPHVEAVAVLERLPAGKPGPSPSRHVHRLHVHELPDAEARQLAAVARLLDPAERQARVGAHEGVHEAGAGLELVRAMRSPRATSRGEDGGAEAEDRVVGEPHRVPLVPGRDDRGHRPEQLLVEGRHARASRRRGRSAGRRRPAPRARVPPSRTRAPPARRSPATWRCSSSRRSRRACGPDVGRLVERVAHLAGPHPLDEELLEALAHRLDHDEALGRDAALAAVDEPRGGAGLGRGSRSASSSTR